MAPPVIWGLPLENIKWSAFKSSNMFKNRTYHLRRTKFAVYQGAMIFCVISESLGTDAISKYNKEQDRVEGQFPGASVSNNDIVGSFSYNIFTGIFVATIFGAAFFFDLFWPERQESRAVQLAWKVCSVLAICFVTASAILLSVIIASHRAYLTGADGRRVPLDPPLNYKTNGEAVASVVLIWVGWLFTIWSCCLCWTCTSYIATNGPFSTHARPGTTTAGAANTTTTAAGGGTSDDGKESMEEA